MDEDEAALLAELRAISAGAAGTSRFQDTEDDSGGPPVNTEEAPAPKPKPAAPGKTKDDIIAPKEQKTSPLPPWKQPKPATQAPAPPLAQETDTAVGFPKSQSNFQGERGGAAEDAALLAEFQAISKQSGASHRFADNDDNAVNNDNFNDDDDCVLSNSEPPPRGSPGPPKDDSPPPEAAFASEEPAAESTPTPAPEPTTTTGGGFQQSLPQTFQGDRGGAAEDEALLAELRAISAQSSSADRFANDDNSNSNGAAMVEEPKAEAEKQEVPLPPWKRKQNKPATKNTNKSVDAMDHQRPASVTAAAEPAPVVAETLGISGGGGGFQNDSMPKTFQGERGGSAEDEDLLAELRAISSKSGSNDRFANSDDVDDIPVASPPPVISKPAPKQKDEESSLPPWKRKGPKARAATTKGPTKQNAPDVDVVVAAVPPPPKQPAVENSGGGGGGGGFQRPSSMSNTFQGERGGAAEDEALLAELMAISSKSGATDRFAGHDDEANNEEVVSSGPPTTEKAPPAAKTKKAPAKPATTLPPWKRKGNTNSKQPDNVDIVIEAAAPPAPREEPPPPVATSEPLAPRTGGFQNDNKSRNTFQGERGGAAEDEALLAELRAISSGAGGASRFADEDERVSSTSLQSSDPTPPVVKPTTSPNDKPIEVNANDNIPPWKRKGKPSATAPAAEVVEEASPALAKPVESDVVPDNNTGGFMKSNLPNTFKGDRGGTAEDEDLLAELRAISAGASSANRFAEEDDNECKTSGGFDGGMSTPMEKIRRNNHVATTNSKPKKEAVLPPWKRKGKQPNGNQSQPSSSDDAVVVAAPPTKQPMTPPEVDQMGGFEKSNLPNTFKGDRGGAAEDEALLAELRAISSGASGSNRFNDDGENGDTGASGGFEKSASKPKPAAALPPWKQKAAQSKVQKAPPLSNNDATEDPTVDFGGFQKTSLPNTFKGDRGGAAEDDALLAELRAISSGAGGANRFSESNEDEMNQGPLPKATVAPPPPIRQKPQPSRAPAAPPAPQMTETAPVTGAVTSDLAVEDLPGALSDKNWKVRKDAYLLLKKLLSDRAVGTAPTGEIDAGSIIEGLDSLVPGMLGDSNAGALDAALDFSLLYAEYCRGATMSGQAEEMMIALVKGSALSASRPSTVKSTTAVVMKLIEVGDDGTASAHAVVDVLLRLGLTSKKPKIVITSAGLILLAATSFGAACLPLALVTSSAPKMLSHTNVKVRDNGMKIIAEIARALGSTSHIQGILDNMKKAQVDQLNAMIEKQPQPAPIVTGFRNNQGGQASGSPEDALAALEAGSKELEAKRFASRPAVNLIAEVAKSEYSTRVSAAKWSEKTAALDKVLECGGAKPYKLTPPSASVNYGPLIGDMKKLLGNTHFAVCGKSMQVLSMLAEGVGEKLFPHLRPLLGTLLGLSKDKKLTKFINPCLDSFFGRVLSFDHLLEDDAIPEASDEKKQKNALARTASLDFLGRCVASGESAGPRGDLTGKAAEKVANLSVLKLEDSDAGVRKAALGVLQNLQAVDNEEVVYVVTDIINGLKKTNPRAHKTLSRTMKAPAPATSRQEEAKPVPAAAQNTKSRTVKETPEPKSPPQKAVPKRMQPKIEAPSPKLMTAESANDSPALDDSIEFMSQLDIPRFEECEENDGILAGLKGASTWVYVLENFLLVQLTNRCLFSIHSYKMVV